MNRQLYQFLNKNSFKKQTEKPKQIQNYNLLIPNMVDFTQTILLIPDINEQLIQLNTSFENINLTFSIYTSKKTNFQKEINYLKSIYFYPLTNKLSETINDVQKSNQKEIFYLSTPKDQKNNILNIVNLNNIYYSSI